MDFWMYYILIFLFIAAVGSIGTSNKPPFKTEQIKEIWQNLTESERKTGNYKSLKYGAFVGAILGIVPCVIGFAFGAIFLGSALKGMLVGMLLFPFVLLALRKKILLYTTESWRIFFASTEWAKSQGIQAEDIHLFDWEK